jgi:hypothetical protein
MIQRRMETARLIVVGMHQQVKGQSQKLLCFFVWNFTYHTLIPTFALEIRTQYLGLNRKG